MAKIYVSKDHIAGINGYTRTPPEQSVFFVNEERNICRMIVDMDGNFRDFPGVTPSQELDAELGRWRFGPVARYSVYFDKLTDNHIRVRWVVRPDGRFFMDEDGFGDEGFDEVMLCTCLDEMGCYTGPFKLYSIGDRLQ